MTKSKFDRKVEGMKHLASVFIINYKFLRSNALLPKRKMSALDTETWKFRQIRCADDTLFLPGKEKTVIPHHHHHQKKKKNHKVPHSHSIIRLFNNIKHSEYYSLFTNHMRFDANFKPSSGWNEKSG